MACRSCAERRAAMLRAWEAAKAARLPELKAEIGVVVYSSIEDLRRRKLERRERRING